MVPAGEAASLVPRMDGDVEVAKCGEDKVNGDKRKWLSRPNYVRVATTCQLGACRRGVV